MKENETPTALSVENVDRIFVIVCFHSERLESHREEIKEMVLQLPDSFRKGKGGGHSFLNMCENRNGDLWTASRQNRKSLPCSVWQHTCLCLCCLLKKAIFCRAVCRTSE